MQAASDTDSGEGFSIPDLGGVTGPVAAALEAFGWFLLVVCVFWLFAAPAWRLLRGARRARSTAWFEFVPEGSARPADVMVLGARIGPWVGTLRSDDAGAVIHRVWDDGELRTFCGIYGVDKPGAPAGMLAQAVGAKAEFCELPPLIDAAALVGATRVNVDPLSAQPVEDPTTFPRWLSEQFRACGGGSLSVCLEPFGTRWGPTWFPFRGKGIWESVRLRSYLVIKERRAAGREASMGGSLGSATAVASSDVLCRVRVVASAPDVDSALMVASGLGAGLHQWNQSLRAERLDDRRRSILLVLGPAALLVAAAWLESGTIAAAKVAGLSVFAAFTAMALAPSRFEATRNLSRGLVVPIRPRFFSARWAIEAFLNGLKEGDITTEGRQRSGKAAHPHPSMLLAMSPSQVGGLVALPATTDSSVKAGSAGGRTAPAAVSAIGGGALMGHDPDGTAIRVPDNERFRGLFSLGDPGTGKTTLLIAMWYSDLVRRRERIAAGIPPDCSIWLDTKGSGADRAIAAAERAHYEPGADIALVDVGDAVGPRLNLFDPALGGPGRQAQAFAEAMKFAFEQGSIQDRAMDVLQSAFHLALATPLPVAAELGYPHGPDPVRFAFWLIGGDPHLEQPRKLLRLLNPVSDDEEFNANRAAVVPSNPELTEAWNRYARFVAMTDRQRNDLFESSRNKLAQLASVAPMWRPDARPAVHLSEVIEGGWPVVICFGARDAAVGHSAQTAERLSSMTLYLLWEIIKIRCSGWQDRDRSLSLFNDELHMIAGNGSGADVIAEMLDLGRDRGMWPVFATQRPDQLPDRTRRSASSMGTKAYFKLDDLETAQAAAADLSRDDETFSEAEVSGLPDFTAAVRMRVGGVPQPPFTLRTVPDGDLPAAMLGLPAGQVRA